METSQILLSKGKVVLIDKEDEVELQGWKWVAIPQGHRWRARGHRKVNGKREWVYMHRLILGIYEDEIDHIDGDPLNNRKSNLRHTTKIGNQRNRGKNRNNSSGYKGVTKKKYGGWVAQIQVGEKMHAWFGFDTPEEAAEMRDVATIWFHGPEYPLNFPDKDYSYVLG